MAERTVPHAYPMSIDYEMCTPPRIYDQNFAEVMPLSKILLNIQNLEVSPGGGPDRGTKVAFLNTYRSLVTQEQGNGKRANDQQQPFSALTTSSAMGSHVSKSLAKWGIHPRKFSHKPSKTKAGPPVIPPQQDHVEPHVYDSVSAEPQYAQVNKKRQQQGGNVHYAEVQVVQTEKERPRQNSSSRHTEYATINFTSPNKASLPSQKSTEAADLFIPPGKLQRPRLSQRKSISGNQDITV